MEPARHPPYWIGLACRPRVVWSGGGADRDRADQPADALADEHAGADPDAAADADADTEPAGAVGFVRGPAGGGDLRAGAGTDGDAADPVAGL